MKNQNIPLAIVLKKIQNGYIFQSLQELTYSKDKSKKTKFTKKPPGKNVPNRLIKEIGLTNDVLVPQISSPPQPQPVQTIEQEPQQNPPIFGINQEEEVQCQVQRETELPKTPAIWFDRQKIKEIQKKQMKQFFSGSESKTPQVYMKYRNFIIDCYLQNPKRYLTKISCRRILRGDVNTIMRVHNFLQKHGLINYAVGYDGNYNFKSNSLAARFQPRTKPQSSLKAPIQNQEQTAQKQVDTDNMTITVINKNFSRTYRALCSNCKLVCGIAWYHIVIDDQPQKSLCFQCYQKLDSTEASQYSKTDIVKKMQYHGKEGKSFTKNAWNIQQNIRLLDFMSNANNQSWKKLLDSFAGKRSIQDIVLQFLQFPISNFQIKKAKKRLQTQLKKEQAPKIGFNQQDYKKILTDFFDQSKYKFVISQIKTTKQQKTSINHKQKQQQPVKKQIQSLKSEKQIKLGQQRFQNHQSKQITIALQMTIQKMLQKINSLKSNQDLIRMQLKKLQTLIQRQNMEEKKDSLQNGHKNKDQQKTGKSLSASIHNYQDDKSHNQEGKSKQLHKQLYESQQCKLKGIRNQNQKKNIQSSQVLVNEMESDLSNQ